MAKILEPWPVGDEIPGPHVRGFDAGDRWLSEPLRWPQVSVGGARAEGIDVQLTDTVAPLPVVQQQVQMLLLPLLRRPAAVFL
jgi:hypothetical protein